jgi:Peptidase A4 family
MSTSSPSAAGRTFLGQAGRYGFRRAGAVLAAAAALALVAATGGGAAAASGSVSAWQSRTTPADGDMFAEIPNSPWTGYMIQSEQDVNAVSGVWTVPTLNCQQTPNGLVGAWAGIGGAVPGQALLQTGVGDSCQNGAQHHQAWWELANAHNPVDFSGLFVLPGERMQASVYLNQSGQWVTRIDDLTSGWSGWMTAGGTYGVGRDGSGSYTPAGTASYISYAGGTTAEWIVEAPGLPNTGSDFNPPMPGFGTVQFSDLQAGPQSWSLNANEAVSMSYNDQVLVSPGSPDFDGDGFSVSYTG